jgi:hypothetical protein
MNRSGSLAVAWALAAPVLACAQAAGYAGGEVMFVSGQAERVASDGHANAVAKGMTLLEGDRIKTGANSHVYVRLRDGGLLVVRPSSDLRVDLWRYDPAKPQDTQVKYTLESGVARQVDGAGVKAARDKFRFNTPMAAIGVRGTDFTVLADPTVTRVSVQSGGVIVNGFGNGCRVEGLGPCEGASAVELFASASNKLLQVRAGERRPEIIDDPAAAPDRNRPAATGEPVAQHPLGAADVHLADSRGTDVVEQLDHDAPPPPPPVTPPPPPPPDPPVAVWGRWAAIAANDTGVVKAEDVLEGRTRIAVNRFYVLGANPEMTSFALPGDGVANFTLAAHDGVITDVLTATSMPSTASNAKLSIDFGARRFATSMDVAAGNMSTQVSAQGSVDATGKFQSDLFVSPSIISGIVGGRNASEAMYLYQRSFNDHYTAIGATSWHK